MRTKLLLIFLVLAIAILACSGSLPGGDDTGTSTPTDQISAKEAIQTYALDVLGLEIPKLLAGGTAGELSLPVSMQDGVEVAIDLAGTTYFGVWSGGIASLSFGDSNISGDLIADIQDGALGVFVVTQMVAPPSDPSAAIELILQTYPALSIYEWIETPAEQGYSFTAGEVDRVSLQSWSVELTGTTIHAGITPGLLNNQSLVWVVVASGVLAAPFTP